MPVSIYDNPTPKPNMNEREYLPSLTISDIIRNSLRSPSIFRTHEEVKNV